MGLVQIKYDMRIPVRDGTRLSAIAYLPPAAQQGNTCPAIVVLTPYTAQACHIDAAYFAEHGYAFLAVDVRGRGNSDGEFQPFKAEGEDGYDVIEWVASQGFCDGRVLMYGGSYLGYAQWAAAKEFPPHLVAIAPVSAPCLGVDFPARKNVFPTYLAQWLVLVSGRTLQDRIFWNQDQAWRERFRSWFESGARYQELDECLGTRLAPFQEWIAHPRVDSYWDSYNPTSSEYERLRLPILTITGMYDDDQLGTLAHYRRHLDSYAGHRTTHHLVVGPWDHHGTRIPKAEFAGIKAGPASLVDIQRLHLEWYEWILGKGERPSLLRQPVTYYVLGADQWKHSETLEGVTSAVETLFLHSIANCTDPYHGGSLQGNHSDSSEPDHYSYDPRDVSIAEIESRVSPEDASDTRLLHASVGKRLFYYSAPFEQSTEIAGFFRLSLWLSIDQPDTDIRVEIYEVTPDGGSLRLAADWLRARYRTTLREEHLVDTHDPLLYMFDSFPFVARLITRGSRLRLVIGPLNSIHSQKNYNSGRPNTIESVQDARTVTVRVHHDEDCRSALEIPLGRSET